MKNIYAVIALTLMMTGSLFARDRYLLLDNRIITNAENAKLTVGTVKKHPSNPLFTEDKPWEKRFDNLYGNVIYDKEEKIYKCWYSPFVVDHSARGKTLTEYKKGYRPPRGRQMGICYATSKDGLKWEKPELGLIDYKGSKANNLIWRGPHGAGIYKDPSEKDPARRYKMLMQGIKTSYSADGIKWSKANNIRLRGIQGDTHNNMFWDPKAEIYVGMTRTWGKLGREVMRIESRDFKTWKKDRVVMVGKGKAKQVYAMPTFFHGGVYLGLMAIHHQPPVDRVWTELAWSPDNRVWHRIDEDSPLIPCSEKMLAYDYGCVYACVNPVFMKDEVRIYYGGSDYLHYKWRVGCLALATLRPDGFAGYQQESKEKPAVITTKPVAYDGRKLRITADVEEGGSVVVSVLSGDGAKTLGEAKITKTVTDQTVQVKKTAAKEIMLKIQVQNAKVYSFSFE